MPSSTAELVGPIESRTAGAGPLPPSVAAGWRRFGDAAVRQGVWALTDQTLVSGASFLTTLMIARACGADELGIYSLGATMVLLASAFHTSLVSLPFTMFVNRLDGQRRAEYAGSVLVHHFGLCVVALAMLGAAAIPAGWAAPRLAPVTWMLSGVIAMLLLREFARRWALAHLRLGAALALDAATVVLQLGGLGWLMASGRLSALNAYATVGLACGATGLAWLVLARRSFAFRWSSAVRELRRSWNFGRWVLAASVTWLIQGYIMHWLLGSVLGAGATGVLAASMTLVMFFNPFLVAVNNLVAPRSAIALAHEGPSGLNRVLGKAILVVGSAVIAYAVLIVLVGDRAMQLLYGGAYAGHGHLLTVLVLGLLVSVLSGPAENGLWALERTDLSFWANLAGLAVTLGLGWPWLVRWGILGGAYAMLAGNLATSAVRAAACFWAIHGAGRPPTAAEPS